MAGFTLSHWGVDAVDRAADGAPRLRPWAGDPDPSPIGAHDLADVDRLRVRPPAVRRSFLAHGHRAGGAARGREPFVEVPWDEALDIVAGENLNALTRDVGASALSQGCAAGTCLVRAERAEAPPAVRAFDMPRFAARRPTAGRPTSAASDIAEARVRRVAREEALP